MGWTDPASHIWAVGEALTAGHLNTFVEANLVFLGTPPSLHVFCNVAQNVTNNTNWAIPFAGEARKTDAGMHSTSVNTSRMICTVAGNYMIDANVEWAPNATGLRQTFILLNGGTILKSVSQMTVTTGSESTGQGVTVAYPLAVNDYVEIWARQVSGGTLAINQIGNYTPQASLQFLGF